MKPIFILFIALFTVTAIKAQNNVQADTTKPVYYCPMHPTITANKPGKCTKCGMALVEKKTYTCGMHPEVALDKPGKCPKCGMALVEKKKQ